MSGGILDTSREYHIFARTGIVFGAFQERYWNVAGTFQRPGAPIHLRVTVDGDRIGTIRIRRGRGGCR
jgi:hypothetical protein